MSHSSLTLAVRSAALSHLAVQEGATHLISSGSVYAAPPKVTPPSHTADPDLRGLWGAQMKRCREEIELCDGPGSPFVYIRRAAEMVALGWDAELVANALHAALAERNPDFG